MAQMYHCKPSEILNIHEEYDAFCFNEACAYISLKIEDGETPIFKKSFRSFSDMYKDLERKGTKCR